MNFAIIGAKGNFASKRIKSFENSSCGLIYLCDTTFSEKDKSEFPKFNLIDDYKKINLNLIDSVIVSTPDFVKKEIVAYFLNHKKNVLVEKPLSLTLEETNELHNISAISKSKLYTAYNLQFFPSLLHLKRLASENFFGEIQSLRLFYGHGGVTQLIKTDNWRISSLANGSFIDLGPHLLNIVYSLFGDDKIRDINFHKRSLYKKSIEDNCHVNFNISECFIEISTSWSSWTNRFKMELVGSDGFAFIDNLSKYTKYNGKPEIMWYGKKNPEGAPIIKTLEWSGELNNLSKSSIDLEFLDKELDYFCNDSNFLDLNNHGSDLFISEFLERYAQVDFR